MIVCVKTVSLIVVQRAFHFNACRMDAEWQGMLSFDLLALALSEFEAHSLASITALQLIRIFDPDPASFLR